MSSARLFLGIAETGIFPGKDTSRFFLSTMSYRSTLSGALYYISLWYPRNEQAYRVGIFFSIAVTGGKYLMLMVYAAKLR